MRACRLSPMVPQADSERNEVTEPETLDPPADEWVTVRVTPPEDGPASLTRLTVLDDE